MRRYDTSSHSQASGHLERKSEDPVQRKLIRPNLSDLKDRLTSRHPRRKQVPPDQTNAEAFYYLKQMNSQTPMINGSA